MKKRIIRFEDLDEARKRLGLDERATMAEIKRVYHRLAKRYHPDRNQRHTMDGQREMKEINDAYQLIMEYCKIYRYSFLKQDFEYNYPELNYQERFKGDWLGS
ncbi:MAG: J domain-containing protein [bacterium]